ncbi:hypothetical protein [Algoriphagus boritolerans]|uniref:hypothetical protein n=1 Tax=Algoriphagus boritolerans TaxID=308111 RepID=UPI000B00C55A
MINRIPLLIGFVFGLFIDGLAQNEEKKVSVNPDFHFRSFWMNTHYPGQDYKEDYALGMSFNLGAVLNYDQKWKLHLGYRTFANITSSEIGGPDPRTGQPNRYETGLFDLLDTEDKFFWKIGDVFAGILDQKKLELQQAGWESIQTGSMHRTEDFLLQRLKALMHGLHPILYGNFQFGE